MSNTETETAAKPGSVPVPEQVDPITANLRWAVDHARAAASYVGPRHVDTTYETVLKHLLEIWRLERGVQLQVAAQYELRNPAASPVVRPA